MLNKYKKQSFETSIQLKLKFNFGNTKISHQLLLNQNRSSQNPYRLELKFVLLVGQSDLT